MKKILVLIFISVLALCALTFGVMVLANNGNQNSTAMAMNNFNPGNNPALNSKIREIAKANWVKTDKSVMSEKTLNTANEPSFVAFLPEGFTGDTFIEYISVMNPNDHYVYVQVIFMTRNGPVFGTENTMDPMSRWSIKVNDIIPGEEVSTMILADDLIFPERAMYMDEWTMYGAHDSIGYIDYFPEAVEE